MDLRLEIAAEALARGFPVRLRVRGRSMEPTFGDGQRVIVRPLRGGLCAGEVVACGVAGQLRVHRVIAVGAETITTQGDANARADPPLPVGHVLGLVDAPTRREPGLVRRALRRLRTR